MAGNKDNSLFIFFYFFKILFSLNRYVVSDPTVSHPFPPLPPCAPHVANVNVGSPNVFVESLAVARIGDSADSGNMTSGSGNVFANG